MKEITYIDPLRAALMLAIVGAVVTAIMSLILSVLPALLASPMQVWPGVFLSWLYIPLVLGATSFFSSVVAIHLYNQLAKRFGGIRVALH